MNLNIFLLDFSCVPQISYHIDLMTNMTNMTNISNYTAVLKKQEMLGSLPEHDVK